MELLIPGLILVALMAYASTRIKRQAALAFEAETVETDEFIIKKPDGFLNVIGGDPAYAFEAYSKEYGGAGAEAFRQATAKLTIDEADVDAPEADDEIVTERAEVIGDDRYRIIETRRAEKGVEFCVFSKIAERNGKVYHLEITALSETTDEFMRNIEAMLDSFELK